MNDVMQLYKCQIVSEKKKKTGKYYGGIQSLQCMLLLYKYKLKTASHSRLAEIFSQCGISGYF